MLYLYEALQSYNPKKGALSTFVDRVTRHWVGMAIRTRSAIKCDYRAILCSLDDFLTTGDEESERIADSISIEDLPVEQMPLYDAAKVEGYGTRQVANWAQRWTAARTADVPAADAAMVFAWLAEKLPAPMPPALLHNDWKFDNLLVDMHDPSIICGVLDWEMATIGDPRFDLATALGYWVQPHDSTMLQALALGVTNADGCLTRQEVVDRYAARRGVPVDAPVYWYAFGLAKVAVIVLQLYARYVSGATHDARFAFLGGMAALMMQTARGAIEHDSLEPR